MSEPLFPCPFCASRRTKVGDFKGIYFVVCNACHADGPAKDTRDEAVKAWNTRRAPKSGDGGKH